MASSSKPISFSTMHHPGADFDMTTGSYSGVHDGTFNPASLTKHYMGSPISWRVGSVGFGGRIYSGSPIDYIMGSLESRIAPISSPKEARFLYEREEELCRNYVCCDIQLTDLHALVEHFEEIHVVVMEQPNGTQQTRSVLPFHPQTIPAPSSTEHQRYPQQTPTPVTRVSPPGQHHETYAGPVDTDEMELDMDMSQPPTSHSSPSSGGPTPPDTPVSTPLSIHASPTTYGHKPLLPQLQQVPHMPPSQPQSPYSPYQSPYPSQPPSPHAHNTTFDFRRGSGHYPSTLSSVTTAHAEAGQPSLGLDMSTFSHPSMSSQHTTLEPFVPYSKFASDYSSLSGALDLGAVKRKPSFRADQQDGCMAPALLFSNSGTPQSTPAQSRVASPVEATKPPPISAAPSPVSPTAPSPSNSTPAPLVASSSSRPAASNLSRTASTASLMLSSSKPFKCPKPGCNKSYKQANGLKYHITHGSCNFAPSKDLEHIQTLLEKKRRDRANADGVPFDPEDRSGYNTPLGGGFPDLGNITETELREVEREAERRLKPFACGIGDCTRRYKNMNGLRYHYQHSGEHGVIGLGLLASGVHECLTHNSARNGDACSKRDGSREGRKSRAGSKPGSRAASISRAGTPTVPSFPVQHIQTALSQITEHSRPIPTASEIQSMVYQQFAQQQQNMTNAQQHQQLQQMQAQFAAMPSRLFSNTVEAPST